MDSNLQGPGTGQATGERGTNGHDDSPFESPPALPSPRNSSSSDVAPAGKPSSKRAVVTVAVVALLALVGVGGWLLVGGSSDDGGDRSVDVGGDGSVDVGGDGGVDRSSDGGDGESGAQSSSAPTPGLRRLPTDPPGELYSFTLEPPGTVFYDAIGSPARIAGRAISSDGEELRVFDGDGTELWRRGIDSDDALQMVDDDVVVGMSNGGGEGGQLTRFDGDNGDELWSVPVGAISGSESLVVYDDSVLVFDLSSSRRSVAAYDAATGEQLAARQLAPQTGSFLPMSAVNGFVVFEADGVYVVDERLQIVSGPIASESMGEPSAWAYMDDEILTADGGSLTRFRPDGTELATADFDVDNIESLSGVTNSVWMYTADDGCGALRFAADQAEPLWHLDDCPALSNRGVVRYENADPLMFSAVPDGSVINALTGETVHEGGDGSLLVPLANGFVVVGDDRTTGYAWPGGKQIFSTQRDIRRFVFVLDQGYAVFDANGEQPVFTVYG